MKNNKIRRSEGVALITGATEGIGYELSKIFAQNRYDLILIARNEKKLHEIAGDFSQTYDITIHVIVKDLTDKKAPEDIYNMVKEMSLDVDILVNNAGYNVFGEFSQTEFNKEMDMIQVLVHTPMHLMKLFLKDMKRKKSGKILNIGSTGSFIPCPNDSVYGASKAFIMSLSEAVAEECTGTGVSITVLCPGATRTRFSKRAGMENLRLFRIMTMDPADVARIGYKALMKKKRSVIAGIFNKIQIFTIRFSPRLMVTKTAKLFMQ